MEAANPTVRRPPAWLVRNQIAAMLVAMSVLWAPLLGVASVAIEYGRALKVRSELQDAADIAVAAAVRRMGGGDPAVSANLRSVLDANLRNGLRGMPFAYTIDPRGLDLRIDASVATSLAWLFGKPAFRFAITSSAEASLANAVERGEPAGDSDIDAAELTLERGNSSPVTVTAAGGPSG